MKKLLGLFIDDGKLAAAILFWVALGGLAVQLASPLPAWFTWLWAAGLPLFLVGNVTSRRLKHGKR